MLPKVGIIFTSIPYVPFCTAKPYLSPPKTYVFASQKVWFRKSKKHLSQLVITQQLMRGYSKNTTFEYFLRFLRFNTTFPSRPYTFLHTPICPVSLPERV